MPTAARATGVATEATDRTALAALPIPAYRKAAMTYYLKPWEARTFYLWWTPIMILFFAIPVALVPKQDPEKIARSTAYKILQATREYASGAASSNEATISFQGASRTRHGLRFAFAEAGVTDFSQAGLRLHLRRRMCRHKPEFSPAFLGDWTVEIRLDRSRGETAIVTVNRSFCR